MIYNEPIFFENNRVFRVYKGGKLLGNFLGTPSDDDNYPEEWIASSVKANNAGSAVPKEGISKIKNTNIYLDELVAEYPREILGSKQEIGILVKYLDSAIRLPIQAHPDKSFSRQYFNSNHGKEECWIVLDTRDDACIYFGFKDGVTEEMFADAVEDSKSDKSIMETLLNRYDVKKGDVILVGAKCVHAIGKGCLILEIQEPTDFTIQPEYFCGDYALSDEEMYIGLSKNDALKCFDYTPISSIKKSPVNIQKDEKVCIDELIGAESENFSVNKIKLTSGSYVLNKEAGIYIITAGKGVIEGNGYSRTVKKGDYFLLPASALDKFSIQGNNLDIVECYSKN